MRRTVLYSRHTKFEGDYANEYIASPVLKLFVFDGDGDGEVQAKFTAKGGGHRHHTDLTAC